MFDTILIIFGIYSIAISYIYNEDRQEVIQGIVIGIVAISFAIINFIIYIKDALKDPDPEVRKQNKKANMKIGEILELIVLTIMALAPLWGIPHFMTFTDSRRKLLLEIVKYCIISVASLFLLFMLNPLKIGEKARKITKRSDVNLENNEEKIDDKSQDK